MEEEDWGWMKEKMMHSPLKKEIKLAMLEKKEKILNAKLDFIKRMKEMYKKMPNKEDG